MAIDNTPPRLKLIVTIAIIAVVTLISLDFVFKSYYAMMSDEAIREKVAPTRDRDELKKAEAAAFAAAHVPVDVAVQNLSKGQRPESIAPQASDDMGALTGWSKLPKPAPTPIAKAPDAPPADADGGVALATDGGTIGDGGVNLAGDAGGPHAVTDGGAQPAPHPGDAGAHH